MENPNSHRPNDKTRHAMGIEDRTIIVGALDSLGVALSGYGHEWTCGERVIYEEAIKCIEKQKWE